MTMLRQDTNSIDFWLMDDSRDHSLLTMGGILEFT